jgi:TRAP-type uncharacterized transport system substrate-binding protein
MMARHAGRSLWLALPIAVALSAPAPAADAPRDRTDTKGVVEIETGTSTSISVRMTEELAGIVNDGATRRVVPVVGKGSLQNLTDLVMLRGVDMAILQQDVLDFARQRRLLPGLEGSVTYVARLYNEEFHLLAGAGIASVTDLANRRVNVDLRGSSTAFTAERLFELIKLPVVVTNDSQPTALEKLKRGEIAAMAFVAAQPVPLFAALRRGDGLHFLEIQVDPKVATYAPTQLTADAYPELVAPDAPITTPAVGTVLAVANLARDSERYRNVEIFVEAFFSQFGTLLEPGHHPKWQEVNLGSDLPGWRRFPAADLWLKRNAATAEAAPSAIALKALFARFIEERQRTLGGPPMNQKQKDELFDQFYRWQSGQGRR